MEIQAQTVPIQPLYSQKKEPKNRRRGSRNARHKHTADHVHRQQRQHQIQQAKNKRTTLIHQPANSQLSHAAIMRVRLFQLSISKRHVQLHQLHRSNGRSTKNNYKLIVQAKRGRHRSLKRAQANSNDLFAVLFANERPSELGRIANPFEIVEPLWVFEIFNAARGPIRPRVLSKLLSFSSISVFRGSWQRAFIPARQTQRAHC